MTASKHALVPSAKALLEYYAELGVDEALENAPLNRLAPKVKFSDSLSLSAEYPSAPAGLSELPSKDNFPTPLRVAPPAVTAPMPKGRNEALKEAESLAEACDTLESLRRAVEGYEGCALKRTATNTVFCDGNPDSDVMIVGEAPGGEEDRKGIPFCGPSGFLLDKMLASIGLDRTNCYISNILFWRPPGNRKPSLEEMTQCLPFVEKHIALIKPKLLILAGGTAATALLGEQRGITRIRGKEYSYTNRHMSEPVITIPLYHPSYLLRQPSHKRFAWNDLLVIRKIMEDKDILPASSNPPA